MGSIKAVSLLTYIGNPTISSDNMLANKKYVDTAISTKFATAATQSTLGTVKVDGSTITISSGTISAKIASVNSDSFLLDNSKVLNLKAATSSTLGGVIVNGNGLTISSGVIALAHAGEETLGGIKVGSGLSIADDGTLSATFTLPKATASVLGGIKVGSGLSISTDGTLSATYTLPEATESVLGGVKAGSGLTVTSGVLSVNYSNLPTASSSAKGGIKIAGTNSEFAVTNDVLTLNAENVKTSLGLGSAAYLSTGTGSGNIPVLGSDGKLNTAVLPALAITDTFTADSQSGMLALSAQKGDICIRTDSSETYILKADGASTLENWVKLATPTDLVSSVAGRTGAVTLTASDIGGLTTSISSSATDVQIPSANAVYSFVTSQGYLTDAVLGIKLNNGSAIVLSSGIANIPAASSSAYGVVKAAGIYSASDWTSGAADVVPSIASVKGYVGGIAVVESIGGETGSITLGSTLEVATDLVSEGPKLNVVTEELDLATRTAKGVVKAADDYSSADWLTGSQYGGLVPTIKAVKGFVATVISSIESDVDDKIDDAISELTSINEEITGDGTTDEFEVTHIFNKTYVLVQVIEEADGSVVLADISFPEENVVKISFASAPASGAKYMVLVRP